MQTDNLIFYPETDVLELNDLPEVNFLQIKSLTDDTGIIQHAIFNIPNRKEGYCIDDNARALLLAVLACKERKHQATMLPLLQVYLSFVHYMQTENGEFKNFMSYTKSATEERGSEDSFGRTIMALGYLVNQGPSELLIRTGADIFVKAYPHIDNLQSIRGIANAMVGLCQYIKYNYPDDISKKLLMKLADKMVSFYRQNKTGKWHWFEAILTYDNAILPLALMSAYEITNDDTHIAVGVESMNFLESKVFNNGILSPIGNDGWYEYGKTPAKFDQQGIDAMAMVLYYERAFTVTQTKKYYDNMVLSYQWFLGSNDLGLSLYDPITGGGADGLHSEGINYNQGAESTLAYWISHFVVVNVLKKCG